MRLASYPKRIETVTARPTNSRHMRTTAQTIRLALQQAIGSSQGRSTTGVTTARRTPAGTQPHRGATTPTPLQLERHCVKDFNRSPRAPRSRSRRPELPVLLHGQRSI